MKQPKEPKTWKHPRLYMGEDGNLRVIYPSGHGDWICLKYFKGDESIPDNYATDVIEDYACWVSNKVKFNNDYTKNNPKICQESRKNMFDYHKRKGNKITFIGEIK